jgi:hypothetical protein
VPWSEALAALIRASIASSRGNREEAIRRLGFAASRFALADMGRGRQPPPAGLAHRRRRGNALSERADAWMRIQKIQNPAGFAEMLAPGKWNT